MNWHYGIDENNNEEYMKRVQNPRASKDEIWALTHVLLLKKASTESQVKSLLGRVSNAVKYCICI